MRAERAFAAAGIAVQAGNSQQAYERYLAAARDFDGLDVRRAAQSRHALAELTYRKLGHDSDAYVLAGWALADFGASVDRGLRSSLLGLQARTLLESADAPPAVQHARVFELLRVAQSLAEETRSGARELPRFEILRGFMEYRAGHSRNALAFFAKAAQQCEVMHDWECYARARQNTATLAEEARDFTVALQAYRDALRVLPPDLDPKLTADIWGNFGRLQGTAGLFRQSEQSHRMSIRLHAQIQHCDGVRVGLARLGTLLVQVGSIGEGSAYLARAASLACPELLTVARREFGAQRTRPDAPANALAAANTSRPFLALAQTNGPMRSTSRDAPCIDLPAADDLSAAGRLAVFNALLGLRDASRLESDNAAARRCLAAAKAYAGTARTRLRLANAEGIASLDRGDIPGARESFEHGLAVADQAGLPRTHENRSLAYIGLARTALLDDRPTVAREHAYRSLMLGSLRADVSQVVDSLQLVARSYDDVADGKAAISILRTAAGLIDQVPIDDLDAEKRATWLATQHSVFADLTERFAAHAQSDEVQAWAAFDSSERGRARSTRYALNQTTDVRAASLSEPSSIRYHELLQEIAHLAQQDAATESSRVSLQALAKLAQRSDFAPDSAAHASLQRRLGELDAAVIEYDAGQDDMFAFVIDSERIHVVRLAGRDKIAAAAAGLYEKLRNPEAAASDVRAAARALAELALWPVAQYVTGSRVILIPDDSLHTVPLAVLPWSSAPDSPLLVQQVELSVVPSTLFVARTRNEHAGRRSAPRFELIGDPVFQTDEWQRECGDGNARRAARHDELRPAGQPLPRLPGSRREVLAIAELAHGSLPASRVRTRLGCEATPAGLREAAAESPELLHIATHGYVDAYRPRLSALALTPDTGSSGGAARFGLLDILNMSIDSRLVVLSACDTSRGRLLPGEGVLGPAQAFLQAGADSVIASYWRIADEDTASFMQSFYQYLLNEHLTAAAALRRAQLASLQAGRSYDWAAFALYGWPNTSL